MTDTWRPAQYERFKSERDRPFFDLLALVQPRPSMRVVDLGCGTGELTRAMHRQLGAAETLGIDSSEAMLAKANAFAEPGLRFERRDVRELEGQYDLVFSNAVLHWVPEHEALFARLREALRPGGQLAVQMPAQHDQVSHTTAAALAEEEPFRAKLAGRTVGYGHRRPILPIEEYAALLNRLGFGEQHARMQVYPHVLADRDAVVEWVKGSLLTDYERALGPELFGRFVAEYRERLPDDRPFFFGFKRILLWGRS